MTNSKARHRDGGKMSPFFTKENILNHRVQRWVFLILLGLTALSVAFLLVSGFQLKSDVNGIIANSEAQQARAVARAKYEACVDSRTLFTKVILRTLNTNFEQYRRDPMKVLSVYRKQLEGNPTFKDNPELIDGAIQRTIDILHEADPRTCP